MELENIDPKRIVGIYIKGLGLQGLKPLSGVEFVSKTDAQSTEYSYTYITEVRMPVTAAPDSNILIVDPNDIFGVEVLPDEDA